MQRRLGAFWSASGLLASAVVALSTVQGVSAANAAGFEDWTTVSAGESHNCGIRHGGKLYCWGRDDSGQIGDGDASGASAPRRIGTFEDWANVSAGGDHTCGTRKNGKLYCWGFDDIGQVGDGGGPSFTAVTAPKRIGTFEDWASASAGGKHSCGIRHGGKLYCWGNDADGQVGDGIFTQADAPRRVGTFEDWAVVEAGDYHTCGVRKNGKLYCWGNDSDRQVGDGNLMNDHTVPSRIGTFEDWVNVSAGGAHTCGVRKNGKLYCWGWDEHGQVGNGADDPPADHPLRVGAFEDWANVSAGFAHTCGVRKNGKLYCWGWDDEDQVGDGDDPNPTDAPKRIGTFEDWVSAGAGNVDSIGVRRNGKLYGWGNDNYGQLGNGEGVHNADTPERV